MIGLYPPDFFGTTKIELKTPSDSEISTMACFCMRLVTSASQMRAISPDIKVSIGGTAWKGSDEKSIARPSEIVCKIQGSNVNPSQDFEKYFSLPPIVKETEKEGETGKLAKKLETGKGSYLLPRTALPRWL